MLDWIWDFLTGERGPVQILVALGLLLAAYFVATLWKKLTARLPDRSERP